MLQKFREKGRCLVEKKAETGRDKGYAGLGKGGRL
jgi:hypothetical protein